MTVDVKDILAHYGILGQKWGVRRDNPSGPSHADSKVSSALRTKKAHELSNDEIRLVLARIQLERQYNSLTKAEKSAGAKLINEIMGKAAKQAATKYTTMLVDEAVGKIYEEVLGKNTKTS